MSISATEQPLNSELPTGGVMLPMPRFMTIMIPKWMGSIPKDWTTGRKIGGEDQDSRGDVHEAANHQQHKVDDEQDDVLVAGNADQCVADSAGQTGEAHNKAHDVGAGNQEHDDSGGLAGVQQDLGQILDLDAAVNNDGQEQGV